ncbi:MAG: hypothetical protein AB7I32_04690 [Gammaproteobacteria bacterium]
MDAGFPDTSPCARGGPSAPIVIDVEASGFGRGSYPIEIGVALADGRTACFLVQPEADWTHWDPAAARLHGISRELLERKGRPAVEVAATLNELLGDAIVYSDAWGMDSSWIALLFDRAGLRQRFRLEALAGLLDETQCAVWADARRAVCADMQLTRHRASADALVIQRTLLRTWRLRRAPRRSLERPPRPAAASSAGKL